MQAPLPVPPAESRQRWRLVYERSPDAPHLAQRDQLDAWTAALVASGLPLAGLELDPPRPRIVFAAPLGVGVPAEHELADLFLTDRRSVSEVREALERCLPAGHALIDLHDVWLGAPPLSGSVVAADYRARIGRPAGSATPGEGSAPAGEGSAPAGAGVDLAVLTRAAARLIAAAHLPRTRDKGGRAVPYDLRPLIASIDIRELTDHHDDGSTAELRVRVRFDPERGVGRPEEVLSAIAEAAGVELTLLGLLRERIVLGGDD